MMAQLDDSGVRQNVLYPVYGIWLAPCCFGRQHIDHGKHTWIYVRISYNSHMHTVGFCSHLTKNRVRQVSPWCALFSLEEEDYLSCHI